jgi:D-arabinose 1-dehydrogenase-like Zn-dependent alcohol dehydrogenase
VSPEHLLAFPLRRITWLTQLLRYTKPEEFSVVTVPLPELREDDILVKVKACGVCGTGIHAL